MRRLVILFAILAMAACSNVRGDDVPFEGTERPIGIDQLNRGVPVLMGASATGVQLAPGIAVTVAHNRPVIRNQLYFHPSHDIAFYRHEDELPWWTQARVGDVVTAVGSSQTRQARMLTTVIVNTDDIWWAKPEDRVFITREGFSSGMSGGPVYNEDEHVIGIVLGTVVRDPPKGHAFEGKLKKGNGIVVPTSEIVEAAKLMCPQMGFVWPCGLNPMLDGNPELEKIFLGEGQKPPKTE